MLSSEEATANGERGTRATDAICERLDQNRYLIDGREVTLPLEVRACSIVMNAFFVDANAAQALVEPPDFRVVEPWPGKALMVLLGVDYRDNPLGDYHEGAVLFAVQPSSARSVPVIGPLWRMLRQSPINYVYKMPVSQEFTMHAGRFIWGFPKWVSDIEVGFAERRASARFVDRGQLVYAIEGPATTRGSFPAQRSHSLSFRGGVTRSTPGTMAGRGIGWRLGGTPPEIGEHHPLARELRMLGLPKRPAMSVSIREATMSFGSPY